MKVMISGRALVCDHYTKKDTGEVVYQLKIFDGRDLVRISGVPPIYETVAFGDNVEMSVRIVNGSNGMFVLYDGDAA